MSTDTVEVEEITGRSYANALLRCNDGYYERRSSCLQNAQVKHEQYSLKLINFRNSLFEMKKKKILSQKSKCFRRGYKA